VSAPSFCLSRDADDTHTPPPPLHDTLKSLEHTLPFKHTHSSSFFFPDSFVFLLSAYLFALSFPSRLLACPLPFLLSIVCITSCSPSSFLPVLRRTARARARDRRGEDAIDNTTSLASWKLYSTLRGGKGRRRGKSGRGRCEDGGDSFADCQELFVFPSPTDAAG
jgi:hypothetical protein